MCRYSARAAAASPRWPVSPLHIVNSRKSATEPQLDCTVPGLKLWSKGLSHFSFNSSRLKRSSIVRVGDTFLQTNRSCLACCVAVQWPLSLSGPVSQWWKLWMEGTLKREKKMNLRKHQNHLNYHWNTTNFPSKSSYWMFPGSPFLGRGRSALAQGRVGKIPQTLTPQEG